MAEMLSSLGESDGDMYACWAIAGDLQVIPKKYCKKCKKIPLISGAISGCLNNQRVLPDQRNGCLVLALSWVFKA